MPLFFNGKKTKPLAFPPRGLFRRKKGHPMGVIGSFFGISLIFLWYFFGFFQRNDKEMPVKR